MTTERDEAVRVPRENVLAAAALLEATGNVIDRREAAALRHYAALTPATPQGGKDRGTEPTRRVSCVVCGHWNDNDGKRCGTCGCRP